MKHFRHVHYAWHMQRRINKLNREAAKLRTDMKERGASPNSLRNMDKVLVNLTNAEHNLEKF